MMKICVLVKSVPDTASTPRLSEDGRSVAVEDLDFVLNPFDEYAIEAAVQLKELHGAELTAVSLGGERASQALRSAFAMGIDNGVLVRPPVATEMSGRGAAVCLAAALREMAPDLILAGRQAVDDDGAQVAERIAEHLGFAHASAVNYLEVKETTLTVNRVFEGGSMVVDLPLPALVTTEKGINEPRYPALPQILKARRKPIEEFIVSAPISSLALGWEVESLTLPCPERQRRILDENVAAGSAQLADLLCREFLS